MSLPELFKADWPHSQSKEMKEKEKKEKKTDNKLISHKGGSITMYRHCPIHLPDVLYGKIIYHELEAGFVNAVMIFCNFPP